MILQKIDFHMVDKSVETIVGDKARRINLAMKKPGSADAIIWIKGRGALRIGINPSNVVKIVEHWEED